MIYEVNSNDPKEGILMSDKNNNVMMNNDMNNNMNNDNDPKERMKKKSKESSRYCSCAVLAGGLAAGSFEGINTLTGWNSSTVEAATSKDNTALLQTKSKKKSSDKKQMTKRKAKMTLNQRQKEVWMSLISQQKE